MATCTNCAPGSPCAYHQGERSPWPLAGYAPGGYMCKCCICEAPFDGDKRAFSCLECAVRAAKAASRWEPIETAPRDGQHVLACIAGTSFGWWDGKAAPPFQTVVHWWGNPGEEGFYTSINELEPQQPFQATHWKPLDAPPAAVELV